MCRRVAALLLAIRRRQSSGAQVGLCGAAGLGSYGPDPRQKLDIYVPAGRQGPHAGAAVSSMAVRLAGWENAPTICAFGQAFHQRRHDGGGGRLSPLSAGEVSRLCRRCGGRAGLSCTTMPRSHGGDPGRIFISGHSAGAYNAVMLASEPKIHRGQGWTAGAGSGA